MNEQSAQAKDEREVVYHHNGENFYRGEVRKSQVFTNSSGEGFTDGEEVEFEDTLGAMSCWRDGVMGTNPSGQPVVLFSHAKTVDASRVAVRKKHNGDYRTCRCGNTDAPGVIHEPEKCAAVSPPHPYGPPPAFDMSPEAIRAAVKNDDQPWMEEFSKLPAGYQVDQIRSILKPQAFKQFTRIILATLIDDILDAKCK